MGSLEELRLKLGYSKNRFAHGLGISVRTYYRWIGGDVTENRLREGLDRLSRVYGVKVDRDVIIDVKIRLRVGG